MKAIKTQTISWICTLGSRVAFAPRFDMACDQQRRYGNASNATTLLVGTKYCVSEELLILEYGLYCSANFCIWHTVNQCFLMAKHLKP